MRDLLVVIFLFAAIYYSFKKPYLGVCAWIWVALLAPAEWAFGFSQNFRINFTIVIITALSYVFVQKNKSFKLGSLGTLVCLFWVFTLITSVLHQTINDDAMWFEFVKFTKVFALYIFVCLTVFKRIHVESLIWAIVLSLSSYSAMEAVKFMLSFGSYRIEGVAGVIKDRNDLAVAINMAIPLILYLQTTVKDKRIKVGLMILLLLNVVSIVGTYSRGGFIGLSILGLAFWLKSNHKILIFLFALIMLPTIYSFAPAEWKERQSTVSTAATEDGSFIGRLGAWKISTLIAIDYPITGGGFDAVTDPLLWALYAPSTANFGPIETPPIPRGQSPKAAHNIYFQVLGDHGFLGFFIFLCIFFSAYNFNRKNQNQGKENDVFWVERLSSYIFLSFVGYGVTGMNVSLAYFDLVFVLLGIITVINTQKLYQNKGIKIEKQN